MILVSNADFVGSAPIVANLPDCVAERAGFELSGDFVNGQQIIRKRQRVQKWLPRSGPQDNTRW